VNTLEMLPHVGGALNAAVFALLIAAFVAIRRGRRELHPKLMLSAFALGVGFLVLYVAQVALMGHRRFPGDDAVRTLFLAILGTHTVLAVASVPLVLRAVYLGARERFPEHRRIVRFTYPIWLYVSLTGVVIYWMNHHLRPPA
jgi:putative membrane protein